MQQRLALLLILLPAIASAAFVFADVAKPARPAPAPQTLEAPKAKQPAERRRAIADSATFHRRGHRRPDVRLSLGSAGGAGSGEISLLRPGHEGRHRRPAADIPSTIRHLRRVRVRDLTPVTGVSSPSGGSI